MGNIKSHSSKSPRQGVNVTIDPDVLAAARSLKLNVSQAAESGIAAAVKRAREEAWLRENRDAIAATNERVEKHGLLVEAYWMEDDGAL